jgi:fructose-bisphosphate aldolase class II/tagatose 1,6-diphosphate aldolase GatY/KbaY
VSFLDSLKKHQADRRAILAANFYNAETLLAVLRAAKQNRSEIILQTSSSTLDYLGLPLASAMARAASKQEGVQAWLHLDHCPDPKLLALCVDCGYDSVMLDASEKSFEDNVHLTRQAVERAHAAGILVEAELGTVPKLGQPEAERSGLTDPDEAARFVETTGVDLLAVAIGTAHGFYKKTPHLDLERLAAIQKKVSIPLVLHGGSGLQPVQWSDAIERGIVKINFATEIKDTFTRSLKGILASGQEIDLRKTFPPAMQAVTALVAAKLALCANRN